MPGLLKYPENLGYGEITESSMGHGGIFSQIGFDYAFAGKGQAVVSGGYFSNYRPHDSFSDISYGRSRSIGFNMMRGIDFTGVRLNKEDSFKTRACFGYQIPIINSSKISRKKNIVKYTGIFKLPLKTKKQKVHFKISVSIPKGTKSKDLNNETEDILKILIQTITQYSKELI